MAAGHVTILGWFEFTFCSAESWQELRQFEANIAPNCIVLGHLLVPELIIKGWDGKFQSVYWYCEFDKLRPAAQFQLLAVCSSLPMCCRANEPCLTRLQVANMEVSINNGSDWKTFIALSKPGQKKISNWLEVGVSRSKIHSNFPGCNVVRFPLVGFLAKVADKKELLRKLVPLPWQQETQISLCWSSFMATSCMMVITSD